MPPAVRLSDKAVCPADGHGCPACPHPTIGPLVGGSPNVMINKLPAIRLGDPGVHAACCGPNQYKTAKGSSTVYVNGKPLVRLGDKTSHCGGSGNVIQGSPNVFADDGGLAAAKAKGGSAKDFNGRDAQDGKYDGKKKDKNGNWIDKDTKNGNKGGKGGGANGEDGAGGKDGDLSKDGEQKKPDEVHSVSFLKEVAKVGEELTFVVECGPEVVGSIKVTVSARGAGDQKKELATTSVEAKLEAEGSVTVNDLDPDALKEELGIQGDSITLVIQAEHDGKITDGENICVIAGKGKIVFALYDEQGESADTEPTGSNKPVIVTKKERGETPQVSATITVATEDGEYTVEATFNDDGYFVYPEPEEEKAEFPREVPIRGVEFDPQVVSVVINHPEKYGEYTVKAFSGGITTSRKPAVKAKGGKAKKDLSAAGGSLGSVGGGVSDQAPVEEPEVEETLSFNLNKAIAALDNNAGAASQGQCAKYVRLAIEAGGWKIPSPRPLYAKDYGPKLLEIGFKEIPADGYKPKKGDVVVLQPPKGEKAGHMQMWNGSRWVSDFRQKTNDIYPGPAFRKEKVAYAIYRP